MAFGFVYLLGNGAMPCFYKIGCTERSPHARAQELSRGAGIPQPFKVLLYIEVEDFQKVERRFHAELTDFRAWNKREFFCFGPAHMNWLWYAFQNYERAVSFAVCDWHQFATRPSFPDDYVETWMDAGAHLMLPDAAPLEPGDLKLIAA